MPQKNSIKEYYPNSYYHLYNRGVAKHNIFEDEQDYPVFLNYLKEYLLPKNIDALRNQLLNPNIDYHQRAKVQQLIQLKNFYPEISLLAFCLMPNHFHLLVKQNQERSIDNFMTSLCTRYAMYYNKKYRRVGSLFQGIYKAVMVTTDEQLIYLSGYIHRQALKLTKPINQKIASKGATLGGNKWKEKYPSSFTSYVGLTKTPWVKTEEVLPFFDEIRGLEFTSYESFVVGFSDNSEIKKLRIED